VKNETRKREFKFLSWEKWLFIQQIQFTHFWFVIVSFSNTLSITRVQSLTFDKIDIKIFFFDFRKQNITINFSMFRIFFII
jgi:hypothetical protein